MKKNYSIWIKLSLAAGLILAGVLFLLWYPLIKEGRLGRIARIRQKILRVLPWWESGLRTMLLIPQEDEYKLIQQNIYQEVKNEMEKQSDGSEDIIIKSAISLLLYLRPNPAQIAFPVDPDQSPLETANDQDLMRSVISDSSKWGLTYSFILMSSPSSSNLLMKC